MILGIDASRLSSEHSTGVEHYSWQLIKNLLKSGNIKDGVILYSREPLSREVMSWDRKAKNLVIPRKRFWTLVGLSRAMCARNEQILFVPSHTLPPSLPRKSVITIHDTAFKYLRRSYGFLQYHYLNFSAKFAVKNATKIIVPSETTKSDLINFYNCDEEKLVVIPHGFSPPIVPKNESVILNHSPIFKHFEIGMKSKYILFVGRLESKKNLSRLIEAFSRFLVQHPDYLLVLAGKRGYGFKKILAMAQKLGMMDRVIMPGYVTEEEKFLLYRHCQFLAFPSLYEGFGLPVLEAFYHGKNVLCSSGSSLPEVGGDAAVYCDPYDVNSIAQGLNILAENDEYCKDLAKRGAERLKKFTWGKCAKETCKALYG